MLSFYRIIYYLIYNLKELQVKLASAKIVNF